MHRKLHNMQDALEEVKEALVLASSSALNPYQLLEYAEKLRTATFPSSFD